MWSEKETYQRELDERTTFYKMGRGNKEPRGEYEGLSIEKREKDILTLIERKERDYQKKKDL